MGKHNHDHDCDCGCNHDHEDELEDIIVTLTDENNNDIECEVVAIFPAGDNQYAAVTPIEKDIVSKALDEPDEIYFFRLEPDEDNEEEANLVDIEDENEIEVAADAFEELIANAEEEEE